MVSRLLAFFLLACVVIACSSGAPVPTNPGATATPAGPGPTSGGPNSTPAGGPTTAPGGGGNLEALARSLVPPGSSEVSEATTGGSYMLIVTTTMSLDQIKAFYTTAIPASGATSTGQFEISGTLTISLANPDGGIVVTPGGDDGMLITISVGTT